MNTFKIFRTGSALVFGLTLGFTPGPANAVPAAPPGIEQNLGPASGQDAFLEEPDTIDVAPGEDPAFDEAEPPLEEEQAPNIPTEPIKLIPKNED